MFELIRSLLSDFLFFVLHITGPGTFAPPLSAKEEAACLKAMQEGDASARSKLIEHNLRLVAHIIKKYYAEQNDQDDLISIGTIGLIKAIDSFDPQKGIRLSSYAARCVENEILMYFRKKKKTAQDVSLNEPIDTDKDGNVLTLMDTMDSGEDIIDTLDIKIKSEQLKKYIETKLSGREKTIICLRYGLHGGRPLPQREVASLLHISRSYVSRLEKKVLEQMREYFQKD